MKKIATIFAAVLISLGANAQTPKGEFKQWAQTPPMGWNSWDCYGPTVTEDEVKANADYMAEHLAKYGWEYVVVDIRWFVKNDKAGGYNQKDPQYCIDKWGRYIPAPNRFPSSADGTGFKHLADYIHSKGLKFGIHLMRGLPKLAAKEKMPIKGTDGLTCDMIASNDSACTWLRDNFKVVSGRPGSQEYYNSCFEMYAEWGVDFVKIDDLSRPYHKGEIEMIRKAIDRTGRPIVLSLSPGETPVGEMAHVKEHANMWRTVDDFWDNWSQLQYQFKVCAKWAPYIAPGTWPDADMLPLGKLSIRGERGEERMTKFTRDEQYTVMNLWTIFKSPLFFGGDLPQNDEFTNSLLTNEEVLKMHHYSTNNRELQNEDGLVIWTADEPGTKNKYVAFFDIRSKEYANTKTALYRSGTISYLTTGYQTHVDIPLPKKSRQIALVVTDNGDGIQSDHADWIEPTITLKNGKTVKLTTLTAIRKDMGWGTLGVNKNLHGHSLKVDGKKYDNGFAVHSNSILLFDIPEDAVRFTCIAGIDDSGISEGSNSSIEFFVYNYDATKDEFQGGKSNIVLDMTKLGIEKGKKCKVTEMWHNKDMGKYKNKQFKVRLMPHASALYKITED